MELGLEGFVPPKTHGTGEPLVLLHGFFGSSAEWATVIPDVKQEYRVIVPNGTHVPIFGETLPSFVKTTQEFLRGDWKTE